MRKYKNFARNRAGKTQGFGIFALLAALCLTGALVLLSCGDSDDEAAETMRMRGFFIGVDVDGTSTCSNEILDMSIEKNVVVGEPNFKGVGKNYLTFEDTDFVLRGVRVPGSPTNPETVSAAYLAVNAEDQTHDRPGAYFLAALPENDITDKTIYTGYWNGYVWRRAPDATGFQPVVICPYVAVPYETEELKDIETGNFCGPTETEVHEKLRKYLATDDGAEFRHCQKLWDWEDRVLNPMPLQ